VKGRQTHFILTVQRKFILSERAGGLFLNRSVQGWAPCYYIYLPANVVCLVYAPGWLNSGRPFELVADQGLVLQVSRVRLCVRVCVCVCENPITGVLWGILDGSFKVALTSAYLKCVNLICEHFRYRHFSCFPSFI
jgi:hypothetical protein